jgi:hypothetical protein
MTYKFVLAKVGILVGSGKLEDGSLKFRGKILLGYYLN